MPPNNRSSIVFRVRLIPLRVLRRGRDQWRFKTRIIPASACSGMFEWNIQ
jgi:hypothetical protein